MCTTPLDGKIQRKITKCYENIEIRRSKVIKKGIIGYLTLQIPVSLLVCFLRACLLFCFIVCLTAKALKSGHCLISIRHVFYLLGMGVVRSNDEMDKSAPGAL